MRSEHVTLFMGKEDRVTAAWREGLDAAKRGFPVAACPYMDRGEIEWNWLDAYQLWMQELAARQVSLGYPPIPRLMRR